MASFWERLRARFKGPDPISPEESAARVAAMAAYMREQARPCLRLQPAKEIGRSWLGGAPLFAPGQIWPAEQNQPLSFLAQLDLAEVQQAGGPDWLPGHGRLLFFFDLARYDAWDRTAWRVLYASGDSEPTALADEPPGLPKKGRYTLRAISFQATPSYPLYERSWHLTRDFSEEEDAAVESTLGVVDRNPPEHLVAGYPRPIQSDFMEAECQLAWNREFVPGWTAGPSNGEFDTSPPGFEDWRLLLQLDSDEIMGTQWHDGGTLYFWVREQDARAGDFARVWLILQCY